MNTYKALLLASYCDNNPECTEDYPCDDCLHMCNVVEFRKDHIVHNYGGFDHNHGVYHNPRPAIDPLIPKIQTYMKAQTDNEKDHIYDSNIASYVDSLIRKSKSMLRLQTDLSIKEVESIHATIRKQMVKFPFDRPKYDGDGRELQRYFGTIIHSAVLNFSNRLKTRNPNSGISVY